MSSRATARPTWRTILGALGIAFAVDAALAIAAVVVNANAPSECYRRFVPLVDRAHSGAALVVLASCVLVAFILRRRAGTWRALSDSLTPTQIVTLVVAQGFSVVSCELVIWFSHGGPFERSYDSSTAGPNGTAAHVYSGGFQCAYEVYVSKPGAWTMNRAAMYERERCNRSYRARWREDGSLFLVDDGGTELVEQRNTMFPQKKLCRAPRD